jgi:nitrogen fixation protein FixH
MQAVETAPGKAFTGRRMLALLVGFFGVVVVVNLLLAFYANWTWTGLVVENSYVASQEYNGFIAAERRQEALGWTARFSHDAAGVVFAMTTREGAPVAGLKVVVTMGRPTHEGEDRVLALSETAPGVYGADIALPTGLWEAKLVATAGDGGEWRRDYRYVNSKAK